jgi:outer membrane lipoprotein SlyB
LNLRFLTAGLVVAGLSGCGPSYSPDTYASNAVQQANKVEQGVVVGVRPVGVSASGTVGTASGAAAGGIAGAQVGVGPVSAITALSGSLVGGFAGSAAEHVTADTDAYEYIVRKPNGDLVSVTQKDRVPLTLGQKVLVIAGNQARVVPDYTVPPDVSPAKADKPAEAQPVSPAAPALVAPAPPAAAPAPVAPAPPAAVPAPVAPAPAPAAPAPAPDQRPPAADAKPAQDAAPAGNAGK